MYTIDMNKKIKNFLPILFLIMIIIVPIFANAQTSSPSPIIPDCGILVNGKLNRECGYEDLLKLVNNIINWIIIISVPVAAGVFAWAGIKYMTTGISDQKSAAKAIIWKVFVGFVFILAAWIIVGTIIKALLKPSIAVPVQININKSINFYV